MFPNAYYVLLHTDQGPTGLQDPALSPIGLNGPFKLTDDIRIERLNTDLAKLIIKACEPPDHNFDRASQDMHLYAWLRPVPQPEIPRYDGLHTLLGAMALSRLVHPASTGFRYCAWVSDITASNPAIQAIPFRGVSPDIMLGSKARSWLTESEGAEVRRLMRWLNGTMHTRVHRAYFNHEYALRLYELDIRWPLIVGGFEALVNTGKDDSAAWQFRDRVIRLAAQFNVSFTDDELKKAYSLRSKLVHAQNFLHSLGGHVAILDQPVLYQRLENLLRLIVKQCLLDNGFNDHFANEGAIEKQWPLRPKPGAQNRPESQRKAKAP